MRLTRLLARLGVSPNAVSFAGMLCGVLAGIAYYRYRDPGWAVAGFVLMVAWHVLDGTDGQLARLTNSQSELGKIVDGICDYVTFIAVYLGLGFALQRQFGVAVWGLIALAGVCHAVQAAAYEVQQQEYNFWGHDKKSAELPRLADLGAGGDRSPVRKLMNRLHALYVNVQYMASGATIGLRAELAAALRRYPQRAAQIRHRYREVFAPSVRAWTVLSANYRTVGIFVCAVLKIPLLYFFVEIVVLSPLTVLLAGRQRARYEDFLRGLSQ